MTTLPIEAVDVHADDDIKSPETTYLEKYMESLSEKEKKAYFIAKSHLGSSFSLVKSVGYLEWKSKHS